MNKIITKEELAELPLQAFEGKTTVLDYPREVRNVSKFLKKHPVLGFDTETRPNFKKGQKHQVALLQLATPDSAFLFRINKMGLPDEIKAILSNPKIKKVGVALKDDVNALQNISQFEAAGFIDIQTLVKEMEIEHLGLKNLAGLLLGFRISKAQQTSNWEAEKLTEAQKLYAATDAWVSLAVYTKICEIKKQPTIHQTQE
jgi:ribonuclease D